MVEIIMSDEEVQYKLLCLANENDKFGLEVGVLTPPRLQLQFEKGLYDEWYKLMDISPIGAHPGIFRIFVLTNKGIARRAALSKLYGN